MVDLVEQRNMRQKAEIEKRCEATKVKRFGMWFTERFLTKDDVTKVEVLVEQLIHIYITKTFTDEQLCDFDNAIQVISDLRSEK